MHMLPKSNKEVDRVILSDYLKRSFAGLNAKQLYDEFIVFKEKWLADMIEFLIQELELNEEGAQ